MTHGRQRKSVSPCEYLPAAQGTHVVSAFSNPAWQKQKRMFVLPAADVKSARHDSHSERLRTEYESAAHSVHVYVDALVDPENLPASHSSHTSGPRLILYVPATQPAHFFGLVPVQPALHAQS